jgi:hypothetical protein
MNGVTGSNRRRFDRMDSDFPASYEMAGHTRQGRITNISTDGCQLDVVSIARVGEVFGIRFVCNGVPVSFRAKILWVTPKGGGYQFGCGFWAMEKEAKKQLLVSLIQTASLHRPKPEDPAQPRAVSPGSP